MYEKLIYTNSQGDSIEFSVNSIYHCNVSKDVTGLAGFENTIFTTSSSDQDGESEQGDKVEAGDIDIVGNFNIRDKIARLEARRKMSRILNPKLKGTLTYVFGDYTRKISAKPEVFKTSKSGVFESFNIQFYCAQPFWLEENEIKNDIAAWLGSFEFDTVIDNTDGMIFGYREPSVIVNCFNGGDVKTGMVIEFKALGTLENPQILNVDTREFMQINTTMLAGDIIRINTEYGKKSIRLTRAGIESDCFRFIDVDSTFMQLVPADNLLRYSANEGVDNLEVTIYHSNKYLGV